MPNSTLTFKLDPNHADAWAMRSDLMTLNGQPTEAIEQVRRALRLNPHPPGWYYWMLGQAQYALRDYESAVQTLRRPETYRTTSRRMLAASLAQLGRLEEARQEGRIVHDEQSAFHHPALGRLAAFPR